QIASASPPDTPAPGCRRRPWIPTSIGRRARPTLATGPPTPVCPSGTTITPSPSDSEVGLHCLYHDWGRLPVHCWQG
uniref:Uncharacterized protein n=1 Tax=Triticum urartu TaxID=4572 RepID=A0A8R7Q5F7_TRIUA